MYYMYELIFICNILFCNLLEMNWFIEIIIIFGDKVLNCNWIFLD